MNGSRAPALVQVPPGVQCFVGDGGAPPPRASRRRWSRCSRAGTTRRSSRRSSTTRTCSRRPGLAARTYSFVGPRRQPARPAPRLHEPAGQDRGRPPGPPSRRRSASTTRARCCATSRPRPAARASCSRWASSTSAATAAAADAEMLAIAGECLERAGRARLGARPRPRRRLPRPGPRRWARAPRRARRCASAWRPRTARACAAVLAGAQRLRRRRADALVRLSGLAGDAPSLERGGARARVLPGRRARGRRAARGRGRAGRGRPRRSRRRRPRRGARPRLLHRAASSACTRAASASRWASGGRYDTLLARFGRPMPAVGFMLGLDRVALLLERQGAVPAGRRRAAAEAIAEPASARRCRARARAGRAGRARPLRGRKPR